MLYLQVIVFTSSNFLRIMMSKSLSNDFKYTKKIFLTAKFVLMTAFGENKLKRFKETLNEKDIDKNFIIGELL